MFDSGKQYCTSLTLSGKAGANPSKAALYSLFLDLPSNVQLGSNTLAYSVLLDWSELTETG